MAGPPIQDKFPLPSLDLNLASQIQEWLTQLDPTSPDPEQLVHDLQKLLRILLEQIAVREPLHFSTLFSLMAYIGHKYNTPSETLRTLHLFRKAIEHLEGGNKPTKEQYGKAIHLGYNAINGILKYVFHIPESLALEKVLQKLPPISLKNQEIHHFEPLVVFYATSINLEEWILSGFREENPSKLISVQGNLPDRNEDFNPLFTALGQGQRFPVKIHLIDVEFDVDSVAYPRGFILQPDHLVDVISIAECFTPTHAVPALGILKKFLPSESSKAILIGNVANYFLDQLMQDPDQTFEEAFKGVFALNRLGFALLTDQEVREVYSSCRQHYSTLANMVLSGFSKEGISIKDCFLEPSFYSPEYGIQGRLDILHLPVSSVNPPAIIELKSGIPFRVNAYGLNANHYIQTLLYDLLVKDLRPGRNALTYILYSKVVENSLRFAPVIRSRQMDALQVRNEIILLEMSLASMDATDQSTWKVLDNLNPNAIPGLYGFHARDFILFDRVWNALTPLEKAYFVSFTAFTFREFHQAKTGRTGGRKIDGQAALWLASRAEKSDQFNMLSFLELAEDRSHEEEPQIRFLFSERTPHLANFRVGDITVLYPHTGRSGFTREQVWKCTITHLGHDAITVRLRSSQFNKDQFQKYPYWHLETDFLDSSFTQLTKSLFQFAQAPPLKRELILGIKEPDKGSMSSAIQLDESLTNEQQHVIRQLLSSKNYFLLWGPPGTGKTSMVLKHLLKHLYEETEESILVLAYTNRAVDEICAAIDSLGSVYQERYIRIGSRFSTQEVYRKRLLDLSLSDCQDRASVQQLIIQNRLFVGTVSSLLGKPELLQLKKFNRVIIDEASQILEPMLCGLLTQFPHFTLIGDHRQLPAVVAQPLPERQIHEPTLQELGIKDAGQSFFERLYRRAIDKKWTHAYGMLSRQGRMHEEIMAFPNKHFYEDKLQVITDIQQHPGNDPDLRHPLHQSLQNRRVTFIPVAPFPKELITKTNEAEALQLYELVIYYMDLYEQSGKSWDAQTLGIITPFRAQIALIRKVFIEKGLTPDLFTIDTVERYQGGARDIILISWCIQRPEELHMITSGETGQDRKLNVALTRAKERLVCLGYPSAFQGHTEYEDFINTYSLTLKESP